MPTISYNSFDKLQYVRVTEDTTQAVYADGDAQRVTTRRRMAGTAVLSPDGTGSYTQNAAGWNALITDARKKLSPNKKALTITADDGSSVIVSLAAATAETNGGDDENGPKVDFQFTEIHGSLTALVTWSIEWSLIERDNGASDGAVGDIGDVLSNTFTQTFTRAPGDPMYEWRVTGVLKTRQSAPIATPNTAFQYSTTPTIANQNPANEAGIGMDPDAYRRLVMPVLPTGYRWESMEFAVPPSRTELRYDLVAKQTPERTPAPAYSGDGDFRFSRQLGGQQGIGVKTFSVELAADADVDRAELLANAIDISKSRIKYVGEGRDFVQSIEVAELNFLTRNAIGFSVRALAVNELSTGGLFGSGGSFANIRVGQIVGTTLPDYESQDPYGASQIRAVVAAIYDPAGDGSGNATDLPDHAEFQEINAQAINAPAPSDEVPLQIYTLPSDEEADEYTDDQNQYPYLSAAIIDRVVVRSTGVVSMPANDDSSPDDAIQTMRPEVYVYSTATSTRIGAPPERVFRDPPPGAIVLRDEFDFSSGTSDAQANHVFAARHVRVMKLLAFGSGTSGFEVDSETGFVRFWPPQENVLMPRDPRIQHENASAHLFAGTDDYVYPVGSPESYLT